MNSYTMKEMPGTLDCQIGQDVYYRHMDVTNHIFRAIGGQTVSVGNSTAATLTVPAGALWAKVQVTGTNEVHYTTSGANPAPGSGTGFEALAATTIYNIYGDAMNDIKFLCSSGETTTLYVEYFDQ
jgi:hypothetical protein